MDLGFETSVNNPLANPLYQETRKDLARPAVPFGEIKTRATPKRIEWVGKGDRS
jgi:hypothetical protein